MAYDEVLEAEKLLTELSKYNYSKTKDKIARLKEVLTPYIESEKRQTKRVEEGIKFNTKHEITREASRAQNILNGINTMFENAKEEVKYRDRTTQDLLHALEFLDVEDSELISYTLDIKETRQMRREAKRFIEISNPLVTFVNRNEKVIKEFNAAVKEMQQLEKTANVKSYTPREKTELEEAFNRVTMKGVNE